MYKHIVCTHVARTRVSSLPRGSGQPWVATTTTTTPQEAILRDAPSCGVTPRPLINALREDPLLGAHQHGDDIPGGMRPAPGGRDRALPLGTLCLSSREGRSPSRAGWGSRGGCRAPGRGVPAGAGAEPARPGSQGGSRDFLLEEARLWQLPVGDGGGGGGWGKGLPAFMETQPRGAGYAGAGGCRAGAPHPPSPCRYS